MGTNIASAVRTLGLLTGLKSPCMILVSWRYFSPAMASRIWNQNNMRSTEWLEVEDEIHIPPTTYALDKLQCNPGIGLE